jgi:hypothetical protein
MGLVERSVHMWASAAQKVLPRDEATVEATGGEARGKNEAVARHQQGMTLHPARERRCGNGPPTDARTWRRCRLIEAGLPAELADAVAADPRHDLHALLQLMDRGCPADLAVRITAPLPDEVIR